MKKIAAFVFTFGFGMLATTAASAECTAGNNGNGCSWSCSGNTMLVSCQNSAVTGSVPRCFAGDADAGPVVESPCSAASGSDGAPVVSPTAAAASKSEALKQVMTLSGDAAPAKTMAEPTKASKLKGQKQGQIKDR
jgi:hypothetical protein